MKKLIALGFAGLLSGSSLSQSATFNQNSSRSNHTRMYPSSWNFEVSAGGSFGLGNNAERSLFRGNSIASKMTGRYQFGMLGLGLSAGLVPGTISNTSLNEFLADRKIDPNQASINSAKPSNAFFLAGPTVQFGNRVKLLASIEGGIFVNNPGSLSITPNGQSRAIYRFEQGKQNIQPGLSGSLRLLYPLSRETRFFIGTEYLYTRSQIRIIDLQSGIDNPSEQTRKTQILAPSLGISLHFGEERSSSGKKHIGNVKYENFRIAPDQSVDQSSGEMQPENVGSVLPEEYRAQPYSTREAGSGIATGRRTRLSENNSCGPVIRKTTRPDGTTDEYQFACPADAGAFERQQQQMPNRISMNVTTPRQTQGATFGEKVQAGLATTGLHREGVIHRDLATRNIIWGRITPGAAGYDILTNQAQEKNNGNIETFTTIIYSREAGSGIATGKRNSREAGSGIATGRRSHSREAGSGIATGRRQYQPIFHSNTGSVCNPCNATISSNPLYTGSSTGGTNPLHQAKDGKANPDNSSEGISVSLVDPATGAIMASTTVQEDGVFWFANVPDGAYALSLSGHITLRNEYSITVDKEPADLAGQVIAAPQSWTIECEMIPDSFVRTASAGYIQNQLSRSGGKNRSTLIWSPRSNRMTNAAGEEIADMSSSTGLPGTAYRPGNPIKGVVVQGGKKPVDQVLLRTSTNELGEFEWIGLQPGTYSLVLQQQLHFDEAFELIAPGMEQRGFNQNASRSNHTRMQQEETNPPLANSKPQAPNRGELKSILIEADLDGDGDFETDISSTHAYTLTIDEKGNQIISTPKAGISTSRSNIRHQSGLQPASDDLFIVYGSTTLNGKEVNTRSVLKTKHDTVKNSINNIR